MRRRPRPRTSRTRARTRRRRCDLRVLRCGGAFTSFKRLVSIRRGRGWSLFRFRRSAQVEDVYKAAEDLNVFEWSRIDKGDDDLALETLVATPLSQSKPDAFQATAAFVRGITAVVARRKESATMIPEAMGYLLKKLQTKTNKHTGCKQCPVCRRPSGNRISGVT